MEDIDLTSDDFGDLIKSMPIDCGIRLEKLPDGNFKVTMIKPDDLKQLDKPELFHIIFQYTRPGVGYFSNYLEHKYFPPETPLNDEFQFITYNWNGLIWGIISIPIEKKDLAYEAAELAKLRIADGIPMKAGIMLGNIQKEKLADLIKDAGIVEWFPLDCDNAFTLEFEHGSDVYEPGGAQDQRMWEEFKVRELWKEFDVPGHDDPPDPWGKHEIN